MKNIKVLLLAAAVLLSFSSCTKRNFTVETGNTPVEFTASTMDVVLNSNYNYIPIQMTAQGNLSSLATFELVEGTIVMKEDGSTVPVEDGVNVIFTSKEIYVGAYDADADGADGLPSNNIEFSIPAYLDYQSVSFKLRLTGEYLGENVELVWTAKAPTEIDITGNWNIGGSTFVITLDENNEYHVQDPFTGFQWAGVRTGNSFTVSLPSQWPQADVGAPHGVVEVYFIGYPDGKLYLDVASEWSFADNGTVTLTNGLAIGFVSPVDGYFYNWTGSIINQGTVGTKQ